MNATRGISIGLIAALTCGAIYAEAPQSMPPNHDQSLAAHPDSAFVSEASAAGLTEVTEGLMATSQGQSTAVKSFGQTMVTDHSKANIALKNIADSKGMTIASRLTADQKASVDSLKSLTGPAFDKRYAGMALKDHIGAVTLFEHEASSGSDADLRMFATQTLPTLKHHLEMAKGLPGN